MFCSFHKWHISYCIDTGKKRPAVLRRHLERCASCRDFARFALSLEERSKPDPGTISREKQESLNNRIIRKIRTTPLPHKSLSLRRKWIPVLSAAAVLGVVLVLILNPFPGLFAPGPSSEKAPSLSLSRIQEITTHPESSLENELLALKNAFLTSAGFLAACLDTGILPENDANRI
jgi:hypothetical protein